MGLRPLHARSVGVPAQACPRRKVKLLPRGAAALPADQPELRPPPEGMRRPGGEAGPSRLRPCGRPGPGGPGSGPSRSSAPTQPCRGATAVAPLPDEGDGPVTVRLKVRDPPAERERVVLPEILEVSHLEPRPLHDAPQARATPRCSVGITPPPRSPPSGVRAAATASFPRRTPISRPSDEFAGDVARSWSDITWAISSIGTCGRKVVGPRRITCSMGSSRPFSSSSSRSMPMTISSSFTTTHASHPAARTRSRTSPIGSCRRHVGASRRATSPAADAGRSCPLVKARSKPVELAFHIVIDLVSLALEPPRGPRAEVSGRVPAVDDDRLARVELPSRLRLDLPQRQVDRAGKMVFLELLRSQHLDQLCASIDQA